MKKTFILVFLFLSAYIVDAQIVSYSVDASKSYDTNKKTIYLSLRGFYTDEAAIFIENEILQNPEIIQFSFYDQTNKKKCMYTADIALTEAEFVEMINDILENFGMGKLETDYPQTVYFENEKALKFEIVGVRDEAHRQRIIDELSDNENIISMEIGSGNVCKLVLKRNADMTLIEEYFNDLEVEISRIINP